MRGLAALSVLCFLLACTTGNLPTAGGSSTTDNPRTALVYGTALDTDSLPIVNATVRLRPVDYLPEVHSSGLAKKSVGTADLTTDDAGAFVIADVEPGAYRIEITDNRTTAVSLPCHVGSHDDSIYLGTHSLKPFARLHGSVVSDSAAFQMTAAVYGLERTAGVDPRTGAYSFTDLPEGAWSVRLESSSRDHGAGIIDAQPVPAGFSDTLQSIMLISFTEESYAAWPYSRTITLNTSPSGAAIHDDVYDFPLLVRLDATNFNFGTARPDGRDIRFARSDGTPLRYEIESWDYLDKRAEVWVLVDTVYADSAAQSITLFWGKPDALDFSNGSAVFDMSNGFIGVWHCADKGVAVNAVTGTYTRVGPGIFSRQGLVGNGLLFTTESEGITTDVTVHPYTMTLSAWCMSYVNAQYHSLLRKGANTSLSTGANNALTIGRTYDGAKQARWVTPRGTLPEQTPVFAAVTFTETDSQATVAASINGVQQQCADNGFTTGLLNRNAHPFLIGNGTAAERSWEGIIDEIRISTVIRSAAWIRLSYENQRNNGDFPTFR